MDNYEILRAKILEAMDNQRDEVGEFASDVIRFCMKQQMWCDDSEWMNAMMESMSEKYATLLSYLRGYNAHILYRGMLKKAPNLARGDLELALGRRLSLDETFSFRDKVRKIIFCLFDAIQQDHEFSTFRENLTPLVLIDIHAVRSL